MGFSLLLVDDDPIYCRTLHAAFIRRGMRTVIAHCEEDAIQVAQDIHFDGITIDLQLQQNQSSGLVLLPKVRQLAPLARILVITAYASIATAVQSIKRGADSYLPKPANIDEILLALNLPTRHLPPTSVAHPYQTLNTLKFAHIHQTLMHYQGNVSRAAQALGINRRTLQRTLARYPALRDKTATPTLPISARTD